MDRDPATGKLLQFREVPLENMGCTAKNSMSLQRAPGPPDQAVRGSNTNFPFWPGGVPQFLSDATEDEGSEVDFINSESSLFLIIITLIESRALMLVICNVHFNM